ncbi:alpha,alpha-trehalose-phosphate synthase (UDP-forming) [Croceicoccus naphthovorans]|uniref:Alpha,alpha-trehalose-phosphate synthase n=1 Tax=Croceicoccus naphthovorans TaxID=1348774 RepID=A0A0G3XGG9_9SPHN|nr:trehalose-6-phosphate synthase [Croceicoccus naphthovorans]AKM09726.1 alpha,alpha-trehalose-phosphate synthase [Croceicoccus naphthovorans]MBB3990740.1 trehalose 6-phosphate synthase [Croceicoccus naphthovorans]
MGRLIVVSNRVSMPTPDGAQGGLAVALQAALRESGGLWFGWSGREVDKFTGSVSFEEISGVRSAVVDLEPQDVEEYYNGFANRTLWPLFHYRIDLAKYNRSFGSGYERVNKRFAEPLHVMIEPGDTVWINDYHLIPIASQLREHGIRNKIGFFLHTPWPPTRLLVSLPYHERLVRTMFDYDVLGFQTAEWLESFLHYCQNELGGTIDGEYVSFEGKTLRAVVCPIGIDFENFLQASKTDAAQALSERVKVSLRQLSMIVGVDRLDYSKGLEERLNSYEHYLQKHPESHRAVVLIQVAPPSRGEVEHYQHVRDHLNAMSGRINGAFAEVDWTPIRYVNRGYNRDELTALYRAARVGLVTPLRDGMNLVAKEYVAAQDPDDPGVLVLSRFAGAAAQMQEALLVNPYAPEEVADALHKALTMPLTERKQRHAALLEGVKNEDVHWWREKFVRIIEETDCRQGVAAQ